MEEVRSDKLVQCVVYLCLRHGNGRRPRVGPTRETARLRHSLRRICVASGGKDARLSDMTAGAAVSVGTAAAAHQCRG